MRIKLLTLLSLILLISACGNTNVEDAIPALDPDLGKSYFFLEPNKYREYDVYEIRYFAVDISDTLEYQLREEIRESFTNGSGQESRIVNRLISNNDQEPWQLDSVWAAQVESELAISVENNLPMVKMVFPVDTTRRWDIDQFNGRDAVISKFKSFNEPYTVRLNTFLEAMEVEISNISDLITFRDNRTEVYADSIGLVLKDYEVVKLCSRQECLGQNIVESGRYYRETLIAHGFLDD